MFVEKFQECEIDAARINFPNLHNNLLVKEHLEKLAANWLRVRVFRKKDGKYEAINFARRVSYQLYPHILKIIAEHGDFYAPLAEHLKNIDYRELHELQDIEKYRASLMKLSSKPVFNETFALRDLYVELNATDITQSAESTYRGILDVEGDKQEGKRKTVRLMQMVFDQLEDREHVVFIQAESGKGKSVFCQMLAAQIAAQYPDWIPVLVCLRDDHFVVEDLFEESIKNYLKSYLALTDDLLTTRRFLFILDGIDELWPSSDTSYSFKFFFERLSTFQKKCVKKNRWRHKIIVTGRPVRTQAIEPELPANFLHLKIENMENPQFVTWLSNWTKLFGEETANEFRACLEKGRVFEEPEDREPNSMKELAGEPLLLCMLGLMHRDGALTQDVLESFPNRIEIYDRIVSWVCGDTKKYPLVHRSNKMLEKSDMTPYELRQLLQEIALCVWQSGMEFATTTSIMSRLNDSVPEPMKKLVDSGFGGVHNVFISFSFQQHEGDRENVEFSHNFFGEYLTAERMVEVLRQIGGRVYDQQPGEYQINNMKEVAHRFYQVFGAALLTDEIWVFVMNILTENLTDEEIGQITERLYHLYIDYSSGHWIDEGTTRTKWKMLKKYGDSVGLLQFEVQVGINLFVLLCLLYQHTDTIFDICGRDADGTFEPNRFRKLLALGEIVGTFELFRRIHHLLKKVNLQRANLLCANFRRANLRRANLQGAVLRDVNLRGASLQGANLREADLRGANLQDANLRRASLQEANLEDVNLRDADLREANLQGANLLCADLRDVDLQGASLQKAVLYGANLRGVIFQDADVTSAIISKQHLARHRHLFSDEQVMRLDVVQD
jgi:hypothetical protein